ncbi:hypothetical protein [Hydrogenimonas thermophila]|uniref:mRNA-degrading endonuclease RelE, toxin component of the RelBE toxin-antitoxin system n=1 Tax=Hydrogenimonas thermophila TaxID=223786 RepID=A0A1I5LYZ5_9BACT|nr:hypothetical protein [Hydrogenimonas thermophila]SFP01996.1 hypothetical protein SAMN05216234_10467 [Hydrogenimonas thermophila]
MRFETLPLFEKQVKRLLKKYPHIKEDIKNFANDFTELHQKATPIKKSIFKVRIANSDKNKGKRSGYRVYYYYKVDDVVYLLNIYDKSKIEMIDEKIVFEEIEKFLDKEY